MTTPASPSETSAPRPHSVSLWLSIVSGLVGVIGVTLALIQWMDGKRKDRQIALLDRRNTHVEYMEMVSRYATDLPGSAVLTEKGRGNKLTENQPRIESGRAITLYEDSLKESLDKPDTAQPDVKQLDLDLNAVRALKSLVDLLYVSVPGIAKEPELVQQLLEERRDFLDNYVRPILQARARSSDPTESAAALLVYSHVFQPRSGAALGKLSGPEREWRDVAHDFRGSKLTHLKLQDAPAGILGGDASAEPRTRLEGFHLERSDFRRSVMSTPFSFDHAWLDGVRFDGAAVSKATFANSTALADNPISWRGAELHECKDFTNAQWPGAVFEDSRLYDCVFDNAKLPLANFTAARNYPLVLPVAGTPPLPGEAPAVTKADPPPAFAKTSSADDVLTFTNCDLSRARFSGARMRKPQFSTCTLDQALFDAALFEGAKFIGGTALRASFGQGAVLASTPVAAGTTFDGVDLRGADFLTGCGVGETTFKECKLAWAALPENTWVKAIKQLKEGSFTLPQNNYVLVTRAANPATDMTDGRPAKPTDRVFVGALSLSPGGIDNLPVSSDTVISALLNSQVDDQPAWQIAGLYDQPKVGQPIEKPKDASSIRKLLLEKRGIILP